MMEHAGDANVMPVSHHQASQVHLNIYFSTKQLVVFLDKPHASCSIESCDNQQIRKDQEKYVMEAQNVEDVCCPEYKKIACREGDSVYQVHFIHQCIHM